MGNVLHHYAKRAKSINELQELLIEIVSQCESLTLLSLKSSRLHPSNGGKSLARWSSDDDVDSWQAKLLLDERLNASCLDSSQIEGKRLGQEVRCMSLSGTRVEVH